VNTSRKRRGWSAWPPAAASRGHGRPHCSPLSWRPRPEPPSYGEPAGTVVDRAAEILRPRPPTARHRSPGCIPVSPFQSRHTHAGCGFEVANPPGPVRLSSNGPPQRSHLRRASSRPAGFVLCGPYADLARAGLICRSAAQPGRRQRGAPHPEHRDRGCERTSWRVLWVESRGVALGRAPRRRAWPALTPKRV
jgi:hypothetical protein